MPELAPENFQEVPEKVTSQEVQVDDEAQVELLLPSESLEAGSRRSERIRTLRRNEGQKKMKKTCTRWTSEEYDALRDKASQCLAKTEFESSRSGTSPTTYTSHILS